MQRWALSEVLTKQLGDMPPQLRKAALFIISHPEDVALSSMRKIARLAGVSHSTMVRLAGWLGYEDYETIRLLYANDLRGSSNAAGSADDNSDDEKSRSSFIENYLSDVESEVSKLMDDNGARQHMTAAKILGGARRIFSVGANSELLLANHFAHLLSSTGRDVILLDATDPSSKTQVRQAGPGDALLIIDLEPYLRSTVAIARHAKRHGVAVVVVTDDLESELARLACSCVLAARFGFPLAQSMTSAMAAVEVIATLIFDNSALSSV